VKLVTPEIDGPRLYMTFDINMGVRKDDRQLLDEVNAALASHKPEIDALLASYGVPRVDVPENAGPSQVRSDLTSAR
jgi:mxaJ protein